MGRGSTDVGSESVVGLETIVDLLPMLEVTPVDAVDVADAAAVAGIEAAVLTAVEVGVMFVLSGAESLEEILPLLMSMVQMSRKMTARKMIL